MTLQEILRNKGSDVHTIGPAATLEEVVATLVRHNVGSLLVCETDRDGEPRMVGIVTERDILRVLADHRGPMADLSVGESMTTDVITGLLGDDVEHTMGVMTQHRVRHLPVLEDGKICGMISIGDVVKAQHDQFAVENHYLRNYING